MLQINTIAPDFKLKNYKGEEYTLSQFKGKKVVLYFYPKNNTSGCTTQALEFKNVYDLFQKKNVVIIGISKDSLDSHQQFQKKYDFPFILLSLFTRIVFVKKYVTIAVIPSPKLYIVNTRIATGATFISFCHDKYNK